MYSWNTISPANAPLLVEIIKILNEGFSFGPGQNCLPKPDSLVISDSQSFLVSSAFKGLDFVSGEFPSGFRPDGVHTSPVLYHHCVQFCEAPSSPVCVIKTKEQQLAGQRLMAIRFTAHHRQCRGRAVEKCITHPSPPACSQGRWMCRDAVFPQLLQDGCWAGHHCHSHALGWAEGGPSLITKYTRNPTPTFETTV